jgi:hypothetical protein
MVARIATELTARISDNKGRDRDKDRHKPPDQGFRLLHPDAAAVAD